MYERGSVGAMTSALMLPAVAEILRNRPQPLIVFRIEDLVILGANKATYELLGRVPDSLDGLRTIDIMNPDDRSRVEETGRLLASGAIEGYRAVRRLQRANGTELRTNVYVQVTARDGNRFCLAVLEPETTVERWPYFDASLKIGLAVTDHDWTIEQVSSDIEGILGCRPETYKGSSLLGLFQPAEVQSFMSAVGRVASDGGAVTLRTHLRACDDGWREVLCLVAAMCQHSPPRLGLTLVALADSSVELSSELHQQLAALGDDVLGGMGQVRSRVASGSLSTRQWQILSRLVLGERAQDIAAALYLSPSTVRNHLTAIYRKFGVHSQAELLAKLLQTLG